MAGDGSQGQGCARPIRILTLRALVLGLILTVIMAWVVPWNDLRNTLFYNNYLPPAVSLVLLCFGLVVNPLLGRFRLSIGEMAVITVMLLGLGGVVSSGLSRYLPTVIGTSAEVLATDPSLRSLRVRLSVERVAQLEAAFEARIADELARLDRDGDGRLQAGEFPGADGALAFADDDGDGAIDAAELADYVRARDPDAVPSWRWPVPPDLYLGIPEAGPVANHDPEYQYLIRGFIDGMPSDAELRRVGHRRTVNWQRLPDGEIHVGQVALAGETADRYRREGLAFLDLEQPPGRHMVGLRAGEAVALGDGVRHVVAAGEDWPDIAQAYYQRSDVAEVLARYNGASGDQRPEAGDSIELPELVVVHEVEAPAIPWQAWWSRFGMWVPLLLGAFAAMIALAGIVRRQWMHNERLPYPIAEVTLSLIQESSGGRRYAEIFRNKAFWVGFCVAGGVLAWNGLYSYGLIPVQINTSMNLGQEGGPFQGHPWDQVLSPSRLYHWKIYFSVIALCFFLSLELSFSLWFFFIAAQIGVLLLRMGGIPVSAQGVSEVSTGGYVAMCALILWIGRHYYWSVVRAACFFRCEDAHARAAAPYLWVLIVGCGAMVGFFMIHGAPFWGATLAILMFLGFLLVLARIVAEMGVPLIQIPALGGVWFNHSLFAIVGFGLPATALMPLTLIGVSLMADPREALLPYAVNADYIGGKVNAPAKRLSGLIFAGAVIGSVVAFSSMIYFAYTSGGGVDYWGSKLLQRDGFKMVANGLESQVNPLAAAAQGGERQGSLMNYGAGAGIVAILGCARLYFTAWPFHPLGVLTMATHPTGYIWFSFFLGWMLKFMVMRYGGSGLYARLKPVAIGLIAGEALVAGGFMLANLIGNEFFGANLSKVQMLPGG